MPPLGRSKGRTRLCSGELTGGAKDTEIAGRGRLVEVRMTCRIVQLRYGMPTRNMRAFRMIDDVWVGDG